MSPGVRRREIEIGRASVCRGSRDRATGKGPANLTQPEPDIGTSPVGVGVVGLGYWGPNLLRVLADDAVGGGQVDLRQRPRAARALPQALSGDAPHDRFEDVLADPEVEAVVIATPVFTHYELASSSLAAEKHTFVEKPLAPSAELADRLIDAGRAGRPRAHVRADVPVQPAGPRREAHGRGRDARRPLLRLLEPGQPRPVPPRRQRRVGPRPARLLHPPALVRRDARSRCARPAGPRSQRDRGRRLHQPRVRLGHRRQRRAQLAGAEQAAPDRARGLARRWSSTTTAPPSRSASTTRASSSARPESFGQFQLSYRTGRRGLAAARLLRAAERPSSPTSCARAARTTRWSEQILLAREVVRMTEAAERVAPHRRRGRRARRPALRRCAGQGAGGMTYRPAKRAIDLLASRASALVAARAAAARADGWRSRSARAAPRCSGSAAWAASAAEFRMWKFRTMVSDAEQRRASCSRRAARPTGCTSTTTRGSRASDASCGARASTSCLSS